MFSNLNYLIENKVIKYIEDHYDVIENDMNTRNSTSRKKEQSTTSVSTDNSKTRKKREELSVSASKSIKKEDVEIIVKFN